MPPNDGHCVSSVLHRSIGNMPEQPGPEEMALELIFKNFNFEIDYFVTLM
jgi:hypothetical protein